MLADALSDVLRTVRLTGAAFFDVVAKAPWVAEQPGPEMILPKILPGAEHMIAYLYPTQFLAETRHPTPLAITGFSRYLLAHCLPANIC